MKMITTMRMTIIIVAALIPFFKRKAKRMKQKKTSFQKLN